MEGSSAAQLGLQLAAAAGLVLIMTVVHGVGLATVSKALGLDDERLEELDFNFRAVLLMCGMALALFALHMVEIAIFAGFYIAIGALQTLEEALFYSASAYATLGRTADYFPLEWRLVGAIEALIGFLLIGWSTAFIVSNSSKMRKRG